MKLDRKTFIGEAVAASLFPSIGASASGVGGKWFRGNIHTHTLVSDGRAFPLEAALLYKKTGYDFLMFSDHNAVHDREMWITERNHHRHTFLEANARRFAAAFPDCKPQVRTEDDGSRAWRYGPFGETAAAVDEPGRFLLMSGCEYHNNTRDRYQLHCQGINVRESSHKAKILPGIMASYENLRADHLRDNPTENSLFAVNHPLWWEYDVDPRLLSEHDEITHFEVCNMAGNPAAPVKEAYDADRLWDYALARRRLRGAPHLYGIASDDTHHYDGFYVELSGGRRRAAAWVMVRAPELKAESLVAALRRGDFYATTGVFLEDVVFDGLTLSVRVRPEKGARYVVRFYGTKRNADLSGYEPGEEEDLLALLNRAGDPRTSVPDWLGSRRRIARIPESAGVVLSETEGPGGSYRIRPDDLYVRAKVFRLGTKEVAWTQPVCA